jgi:predicted nucleotidyltransferase
MLCLAKETARQLKAVYGEHLLDVVLFGSWVRAEAHEESSEAPRDGRPLLGSGS